MTPSRTAEHDLPKTWYNILADLPVPLPPALHPGTRQPIGPADLAPLFPMEIIRQEVSTEREIEIPGPVRDIYRLWRPTPLHRAYRLEQLLQTPAHIYYKYEGTSPAGSHKPNTAVAQAFYNKQEGTRRLTTETGAGQWGSALALASRFFDLECTVYMVRVSYEQKPYRRLMMETWGAEVLPSPSGRTNAGRSILGQSPDSLGSLGIAISEAVEDAATHDDTKYSIGSVANHVLLHQTVIGLEAKKQMALAGEGPDVVVGCVGGGSNYCGLAYPFLADRFKGEQVRFVAVEPTACPSLTKGRYLYDFGDTAATTPLFKMYTLGHTFVPPGIHEVEKRAVFDAAVQSARAAGISPAPESAHAIRHVVNEALQARERGEKRVILFNLSGHGHFDLKAYEDYLAERLEDSAYPEEAVALATRELAALQP